MFFSELLRIPTIFCGKDPTQTSNSLSLNEYTVRLIAVLKNSTPFPLILSQLYDVPTTYDIAAFEYCTSHSLVYRQGYFKYITLI